MVKNVKRIEVEDENGNVIKQYTTLDEFFSGADKLAKSGADLSEYFPYVIHTNNSTNTITFSGEEL